MRGDDRCVVVITMKLEIFVEVAKEGVDDLIIDEDHKDVEDEHGEQSGHGRGLGVAAGLAMVSVSVFKCKQDIDMSSL